MKNIDVINLANKLRSTSFADVRDFKFNYAVLKNKDRIEAAQKAIFKMVEDIEPEQHKLLKAEILPKIQAEPEKEKEILESWEKADEWRKSNQEYQSLIESVYDEESDFIPHKISIELIESLGLNFNQFEAVYPLI